MYFTKDALPIGFVCLLLALYVGKKSTRKPISMKYENNTDLKN